MAYEALLVSQLLVVAAMWSLGVWLLYLNPSGRVHRAFSLLLLVWGLLILLNQVPRINPDADKAYWNAVRVYPLMALTPALLNLLVVYTWRQPTIAVRAARWAILLGTIIVELLFLLRADVTMSPPQEPGYGLLSPLPSLFNPLLAFGGILAWFLAASAAPPGQRGFRGWGAGIFEWFLARSAAAPAQRRFHRLLGAGFTGAALAEGPIIWSVVIQKGFGGLFRPGLSPAMVAAWVIALFALPIALVAAGLLLREARREENGSARRLAWLFAFCFLPSFLGSALEPVEHGSTFTFHLFLFFLGLARLTAVGLLAYAVARPSASRTDPFDLDVQARVTLKRSTVGAIFVGLFVILSEGAQFLLQNYAAASGTVGANAIGIVGAAGLVLALYPLRRAGERMAQHALPRARPIAELSNDDRLRVYEEQAQIAWTDGTLTRKERLLLDRLRERLGIDAETAHSLESRAAGVPPSGA